MVLNGLAGSSPAPGTFMRNNPIKWTRELAYATGLITTDGSLSIDGRHIVLTSTDKKLLNTCLRCLKKSNKISSNPISKLSKQPAFRIQIGDVALYKWFLDIGLFPNKSLHLGSLAVPDRYFSDFLRGHLDGDGSIIHYVDRYLTKQNPKYVYDRLFVYFRSASKKHVQWIQSRVFKLIHICGSLNVVKSKTQIGNSTMYILKGN